MTSTASRAGTVSRPSCLFIAEAGVNHNGDVALAEEMVRAGVAARADVVKFQTFSANRLASRSARKARYQEAADGTAESHFDMLARLELGEAAHRQLAASCSREGIEFLSTPFDEASADLLDALGVRRFKVSSGDVTNQGLLRHIAAKGKPILLSTGMCYLGEVEAAVRTLERAGCADVTLLHCTSSYPTEAEDCNLRSIEALKSAFGLPVGYSDHTTGIEIACAAVALGISVIEKHFTLNKGLPGPDHRASLDPIELKSFGAAIRRIERALGDGFKRPMPGELDTRAVARRSWTAARALEAGATLRREDLVAKRPGTGIPPQDADRIVGRRVSRAVRADETLTWELLE